MWVPSDSSQTLSGTHRCFNRKCGAFRRGGMALCVDGCAAVLTSGQWSCTAVCPLTGCLKTSASSSHPKVLQHSVAILFLNLSLSDSSCNQFSILNACNQTSARLEQCYSEALKEILAMLFWSLSCLASRICIKPPFTEVSGELE